MAEAKDKPIVIVAVDGSEFSDYALEFYLESLHKAEHHVILAHCTEYKSITSPGIAVMTPFTDSTMSQVTEKMKGEEKKADELAQQLTEKLEKLKIDGEVSRTHGEPGPAVVSLATEKQAIYVVVGCRGKGTIRRTVTGSVTDYITHHCHVPVVVARHKDHLEHHSVLGGLLKHKKSDKDKSKKEDKN